MTNLECTSASGEKFQEFLNSIRREMTGSDERTYKRYIRWLSIWADAPREEQVVQGRLWVIRIPDENEAFKLKLIEIKAVVTETRSGRIQIVCEDRLENNGLEIFPCEQIVENGILVEKPNEEFLLQNDGISLLPKLAFLNKKTGDTLHSDLEISELELSVRSYNCLKRAGFSTLGDIARLRSQEDFKPLKKYGKKPILEVINKLKEFSGKEGFEWLLGTPIAQLFCNADVINDDNLIKKQENLTDFTEADFEEFAEALKALEAGKIE